MQNITALIVKETTCIKNVKNYVSNIKISFLVFLTTKQGHQLACHWFMKIPNEQNRP